MLAADKLLLQSSIRQNSIALKEKEFNLHHGNFNAVGTQAAVLAGFTVTAFIEFDCPPDTNRATKFAYYVSSIVSLAANILCVANTTFLSVWGTGLAMRGPDGSMARAVDGMYQLRRNVFALFGLGMMALLVTAIFGSWILMNVEAAAASTCVEIKILRRVRAESPRRPPRHRRDACSMAWRCRFITARRSQHGHVIAVHPTHWLISTQSPTASVSKSVKTVSHQSRSPAWPLVKRSASPTVWRRPSTAFLYWALY